MLFANYFKSLLRLLVLCVFALGSIGLGQDTPEIKNAKVSAQKDLPQVEVSPDKLIAKAKSGNVESMIAIRHRMLDGENFDITQDTLVNLIQKAAEKGNPDAQYEMGLIVQSEQIAGSPKNDKESIKWFSMAAKQDHVNSIRELGCNLFYGFKQSDMKKDRAKGLDLLKKAIKMGSKDAEGDLGFISLLSGYKLNSSSWLKF
jgi:TPR repeat protein